MRCSTCDAILTQSDDRSHLQCEECGAIQANPDALHGRPLDGLLDDLLTVPSDQEMGRNALAGRRARPRASDQGASATFETVTDALDAALGVASESPANLATRVSDGRAARLAAREAIRARRAHPTAPVPSPQQGGVQVKSDRSTWVARLVLVAVGLVIAATVAAAAAVAILG